MNIIDRITSGNWYVKEVQRAGKDYYVLRELNDIAFLNHYNGLPETEQKANALAISKVPEMLELIERFVNMDISDLGTNAYILHKEAKQLWEELNKQS